MKKLKKLTAVILAAVMVLSMSTAAFAGTSASNTPITEIIYLSSWNSVIKKKNNYYYEPTTQKTYLYNNGQIELSDKSSVKYTYYKSGNLKTMTEKVEGSRTVTKCTYNKNGKLKKITDNSGATYIYKNGKLIQYTAGNDYKILYKTNSAGNVTQAAFYYDGSLNSKEIHKYKYYKKKYVSTEIVYIKRSGSSKTKESKVVNSGFVKIYSTIPTTTSEVCY